MKFVYSLLLVFCMNLVIGQAYEINVRIKNYSNDTLVMGYYYGDRQLVKDTAFVKSGKFCFKDEKRLEGGMYLFLTKPDNGIVQFLVPEDDQSFDVEFDYNDKAIAKFKGSTDNELFYEYLDFLTSRRKMADPIRAKIKEIKDGGLAEDKGLQDQLDKIDKEVVDKQEMIKKNHPKTVTYQLLKSNEEIQMPEFDATGDSLDLLKFLYYKEHFFDNIDFTYPSLVRTPYFWNKVDNYLEKLTVRNADSINTSIDYVLGKLKGVNPDGYKFCLSNILNIYAKNKYIGMDGVYVHMIDKYYSKNEADWVDEETLLKMTENADNLRPILIGKTFPNITVYKEDQSPVMVNQIASDYLLLIFWAPDCGHCKKSMPDVVKAYEDFKDKGLKVVSVCTKSGDKFGECWEDIGKKGMENFINTGDEYQRYRKYVYIPSTPKIFILDKDKKILIKDVPAEELTKIMNDFLGIKNPEPASDEQKQDH